MGRGGAKAVLFLSPRPQRQLRTQLSLASPFPPLPFPSLLVPPSTPRPLTAIPFTNSTTPHSTSQQLTTHAAVTTHRTLPLATHHSKVTHSHIATRYSTFPRLFHSTCTHDNNNTTPVMATTATTHNTHNNETNNDVEHVEMTPVSKQQHAHLHAHNHLGLSGEPPHLSRTASQLLRSASKTLTKTNFDDASSAFRGGATSASATTSKRAAVDAPSLPAHAVRRASKVARRSPRGAPTLTGVLSELPTEILDAVATHLTAEDLGRLTCTCRYFATSSLVERASRELVSRNANAHVAALQPAKGETWLRLLWFQSSCERSSVATRHVSLGSYHTLATIRAPLPSCRVVDDDSDRSDVGDDDEDEAERLELTRSETGTSSRLNVQTAKDGEQMICAFGRGFHGQLGRGGYERSLVPAPIALSSADEFLEGLRSLDVVEESAEDRELGLTAPTTQTRGAALSAGSVTVVCGASHSAAILPSGKLFTWGLASSGELGHGGWTPIELAVPRRVGSLGSLRVSVVAAGSNHTLAVATDGSLWSCGRGRHGQLGHGAWHDAGPFARVEGLSHRSVRTAGAGAAHSLALCEDGAVYGWGANAHGESGLPDTSALYAWPTRIPALPADVSLLSCGSRHSMVMTFSGALYAFGRGRHGALGLGDDQDALAPRLVPLLAEEEHTNAEVAAVAFRVAAAAGRRSAGAAQLTAATCASAHRSSAQVPARCVSVACGGAHTVAVIARGSGLEVRSTGANAYGQLGLGDTNNRHFLCRVQGVVPLAVAAGDGHTAALCADGSLYTWGRNDWGQLGLGDSRGRRRPCRVGKW